MPDEQTPGAVLEAPTREASPPAESPSGGGLGANVAATPIEKAPEPEKTPAWSRLQSELDRERNRRERAESDLASAYASLSDSQSAAELADLQSNAPDPVLEPEKAATYWKQAAITRDQLWRDKSQQAERARLSEQRTEAFIADTFRRVEAEHGVKLDRSTKGLVLTRGGEEARQLFLDSVNAIVERETGVKQLREELKKEVAKEMGIDRFDGGPTGGSVRPTVGTLTPEQIATMPNEEYAKYREEIINDPRVAAAFSR